MITRLLSCLVASVVTFGGGEATRQEPRRTESQPAAERCCAAAERRLEKRRLPPAAREPQLLRDLYRFVGSHLDLMRQLPCFCGCDAIGHRSAAECFVRHPTDGRRAAWSSHGAGCGMCIGIARDAMLLQQKNAAAAEIRRHVQVKYGKSSTLDRSPSR